MTIRAKRTAGVTVLLVAAALGLLASTAAAAEYQVINGTGPIESIAVGDELSCQVSYVNDVDFEFYPPDTTPGDCGTLLATGGTLYAPDFSSHDRSATGGLDDYVSFIPVSQSGVQGQGTAADPYRVVTTVEAAGAGLRITETTSYVNGSNFYRTDTAVTNSSGGASVSAVLYHAGDCYANGSDIGFGFTRSEVGVVGCSESAQNTPAGRTVQMAPLSATSRYYEASYSEVWAQIATKAPLPNTCRCGEHIDNGVALSWELSLGSDIGSGTVRSLATAFTESTPPNPGADSDGDGLPDGWETGSAAGGDYENLAPLGADPHRKDVFVHLDYKEGCAPPAKWELPAIQAFKEHGIALHVDSGPDSINADGQPWGSRSRAGGVSVGDDIALWDAFDRLKDQRFIAANRRRAFHYAVILKRFNGGDGGVARNIPEADFAITGCEVPDWLHLGKARYITAVFVHELGHNLGLRHGGGDDVNGKPNYYGIMNYFWTAVGGVGKGGELKGLLPDYSWYKRPPLDERHLNEREPQILPVAWNCPGHRGYDARYELGPGARPIDWDCDGIRGELHRDGLNVNSTWDGGAEAVLNGFNDWAPGAMRFDGGGVLGDFDLPQRSDPPVVAELSPEELRVAQKAFQRSRRQARRRLLVDASRRRLLAGRVATLRIGVTTAADKKAKVRGALIRIGGAKLLLAPRKGRAQGHIPRRLLTGRRGKVLVRLVPRRSGKVRIFASRGGFARGGLIIPVSRKR